MGVSINTTICITEEYQFQFQYEGQWKQPFHIKRMHRVNQTIGQSAGTKRGHFSAEKSDFRGMERLWCVQQRRCIPRKMGCPDPRGGEERRATTLAPPPPEPAPECHTAREPGSQGNTERRAWVRHFQGLGTTTITTTAYYHCHNQNRNHQEP